MSTTVRFAVHVAVLPAPSVAVSVTAVTPRPMTVPAAGLCVTVTEPQLSLAVT